MICHSFFKQLNTCCRFFLLSTGYSYGFPKDETIDYFVYSKRLMKNLKDTNTTVSRLSSWMVLIRFERIACMINIINRHHVELYAIRWDETKKGRGFNYNIFLMHSFVQWYSYIFPKTVLYYINRVRIDSPTLPFLNRPAVSLPTGQQLHRG